MATDQGLWPSFTVTPFRLLDPVEPPLPPPSPPGLRASLAAIAAVGDRFDLDLPDDAPAVDEVLASAISDERLEVEVAGRARGLNTSDMKASATLFLQAYTYRIAAPALGSWVMHGRVPDVSADNVRLRFVAGRPVGMRLVRPRFATSEDSADGERRHVPDLVAELERVLLDAHLLPLMERLRSRYRLGSLLAKGAVASQIGMALTCLDARSATPWRRVGTHAVAFFRSSTESIAGEGKAGDMIVTTDGRRTGVTWRRRTCCLAFHCDNREKCGGCPLRPDAERLAVWADRLANRPARSFETGE